MTRTLDDLEMMNPENLLLEDQYFLGVDPEELSTASNRHKTSMTADL